MRYRARTDAERLDFRSTRVCERDGSEHERTSRRILSAGVVNCSDEGVLDVCAQARLSDKDIELMMKNLTEDAKKFRFSTRPSATARSKKRHARRMRKAFAQRFQNNTEAMLRQFQKQQEGGRTLPVVLQGARNIERINTHAASGHV
jgi:hypothetical protein